jgi:hypothetical protein
MTDGAPQAASPAPARRHSRGGIAPVALASLATFLVVLVFLAVQMWLGSDPVLHPRSAAATAPARQVLVRRIEKRTVLVRVIPAEQDDGASPAPRGTAVVVSAPATPSAPAAAPAPAPAPIVTRTS